MRRRKQESGFALLLVFVLAAAIAISLYTVLPRAAFESQRIVARTEDLLRNNPYAVAMVETMTAGALGPKGLTPKSLYQEDVSPDTSDHEQKVRDLINAELESAFAGTCFDAGGQMTKREMSLVILTSMIADGDGFSNWCWRPLRPGRHSHSTCWRIFHPSRVTNEGFASNTDRAYEGFDLDANGVPVGINVLRTHPASLQQPSMDWMPLPIYHPSGLRQVTHLKSSKVADSSNGRPSAASTTPPNRSARSSASFMSCVQRRIVES